MPDQSTTPQLEDVIRMFIADAQMGMNVCLPGVVQSFDTSTGYCSVAPALMRFYEGDSAPTALPIINRVPVVYPRGGNFRMKWNLVSGDPVVLIFSQRSLDVWKSKGGVVDPADPRKFHLSDAYAIPGGPSLTAVDQSTVSGGTVLRSGSSMLTMGDAGTFRLENGSNELLDVLTQITSQLATIAGTLSTTTTNTQLGPQMLKDAAAFASAQSAINALKSKLMGLKG